MATVLTIELIVLSTAAAFLFGYAFPRYITSEVRSRLWMLRDWLVDDINAGVYDAPLEARRLVAEIEDAIRLLPELSAFRVFLVHSLVKREGLQGTLDSGWFDPGQLSPADRGRIHECYHGYQRALVRKVLAGSPSGLVLLLWRYLAALPKKPHSTPSSRDRLKHSLPPQDVESAFAVIRRHAAGDIQQERAAAMASL